MKEYKTFNQQLTILRNRGLIVPTDGKPKRFLEQENYYNVINGYKDLFLLKDTHGKPVEPETYLSNAHFNELKTLFLFDRELRFLFLKYLLIFENSFKTVISHEFSRKYPKANSYLDIANYREDDPKGVLKQISILTKTIHDNVGAKGAIKHYIEDHGSVPLWVLVNYLTIGNLSYLYGALKDSEKKVIITHKPKNIKINKYEKASKYILYRMINDNNMILYYFNNLSYLPNDTERKLASEIVLFYKKFNSFNLSDFIIYLEDKKELINLVVDISDLKYTEDELNDNIDNYFDVIKESLYNNQIVKLTSELKNESNSVKRMEIAQKIVDLKIKESNKDE